MNASAHPLSGWTQEERELIAERLRAGDSASQIARLFDGRTRNAIVGVIHRDKELKAIGLRRTNFGGGNFKTARPKKASTGRVIHSTHSKPLPAYESKPLEPHVAGQPSSMLRADQCRYAVNDAAKGGTHLFCGLPADGSWCGFHRGIVYQPGTSLRDKRGGSRMTSMMGEG